MYIPPVGLAIYVWATKVMLIHRWKAGGRDLRIWRGIVFRKVVTIPYMKVQNVDVVHGPLLLLSGLSAVEVKTAGERAYRSIWYSTEGYIPGVVDGEAWGLDREEASEGGEGGGALVAAEDAGVGAATPYLHEEEEDEDANCYHQ